MVREALLEVGCHEVLGQLLLSERGLAADAEEVGAAARGEGDAARLAVEHVPAEAIAGRGDGLAVFAGEPPVVEPNCCVPLPDAHVLASPRAAPRGLEVK